MGGEDGGEGAIAGALENNAVYKDSGKGFGYFYLFATSYYIVD